MKRLQVTDDLGWTHITKGTTKQRYRQKPTVWSSSSDELKPTDIPRSLTLHEVTDSFDRCTKIWKASSSLKNLRTLIKDDVLTSNIEITNCVCLGLGSFTGGDRTETSFYELAAMVSILEILGQHA